MRILYITTVGITMGFFKELIKELVNDGHTVDIATNETEYKVPDFYRELGYKIYPLECTRSPFNKGNINAIKQIKQLVQENQYDIVHCHTPIAAMCTRIACRKLRKKGLKVIYTAHGFHFYKGAPLKNWLIYYPVEWLCAFVTDTLITINKEDYALAKKYMHAKCVEYVPGVGIDVVKFANVQIDRTAKRRELGVPEDAIILTSIGEISKRKNHKVVLQALTKINNEKIHYVIVGKGPLLGELQSFVKEYGISHRVHFLGYRNDIAEIYKASDICCLPSIHEGLPVALMEAMACGLPVICSRIRGNTDLIDASGGILFDYNNADECCQAILNVLNSDMKRKGIINKERVQDYSVDKITLNMKRLYES